MSEQSKTTKNSNSAGMSQLDLMSKNRTLKKVKYQDMDGKEHELEVTLKHPGDYYRILIGDLVNNSNDTSDFVQAFQVVIDRVIVAPAFNYKYENEQLKKAPKALRQHKITATNKDGDSIHLNVNVPSYQDMIDIIFSIYRPSGALNTIGMVKKLDEIVWTDNDGKHLDEDFWTYGKPGDGFMESAMNETANYLSQVINRDGFLNTLSLALRFLTGQAR